MACKVRNKGPPQTPICRLWLSKASKVILVSTQIAENKTHQTDLASLAKPATQEAFQYQTIGQGTSRGEVLQNTPSLFSVKLPF